MKTAAVFLALFVVAAVGVANFKCCVYSFVDPEHAGNPDEICPQLCVSRYASCPLPASYVGVCYVDPAYERPSTSCKSIGCRVPRTSAGFAEDIAKAAADAATAATAARS